MLASKLWPWYASVSVDISREAFRSGGAQPLDFVKESVALDLLTLTRRRMEDGCKRSRHPTQRQISNLSRLTLLSSRARSQRATASSSQNRLNTHTRPPLGLESNEMDHLPTSYRLCSGTTLDGIHNGGSNTSGHHEVVR